MGQHAQKVQSPVAPGHGGLGMTATLNGETLVMLIIGDPIAQVKSPALLTERFAAREVNAVCVPGHVRSADIPAFMAGLRAIANAPGLVITVPHKQAAMGYCDVLTERARYAQSVNVMRRTAAGWVGDNTDGQGYCRGIAAAGGTIAGKRVLLVGAGGAGAGRQVAAGPVRGLPDHQTGAIALHRGGCGQRMSGHAGSRHVPGAGRAAR